MRSCRMRISGRHTTAKDLPRAGEDSRGFGHRPASPGPKMSSMEFSRRFWRIFSGPRAQRRRKNGGRTFATAWKFPWRKQPLVPQKRFNSTASRSARSAGGVVVLRGQSRSFVPTAEARGPFKAIEDFLSWKRPATAAREKGNTSPDRVHGAEEAVN